MNVRYLKLSSCLEKEEKKINYLFIFILAKNKHVFGWIDTHQTLFFHETAGPDMLAVFRSQYLFLF